MSISEEAPGETQETLKRLCLSAGLETPWNSPRKTGSLNCKNNLALEQIEKCLRRYHYDYAVDTTTLLLIGVYNTNDPNWQLIIFQTQNNKIKLGRYMW